MKRIISGCGTFGDWMDRCFLQPASAPGSLHVDIYFPIVGGLCCGCVGLAFELQSHLTVQHPAQLIKDQLKCCPSVVPLQSAAVQNTSLLSSAATVPEMGRPSRGSRRARQPQRVDSAPREEPTPVESRWDEEDKSKLQVNCPLGLV